MRTETEITLYRKLKDIVDLTEKKCKSYLFTLGTLSQLLIST